MSCQVHPQPLEELERNAIEQCESLTGCFKSFNEEIGLLRTALQKDLERVATIHLAEPPLRPTLPTRTHYRSCHEAMERLACLRAEQRKLERDEAFLQKNLALQRAQLERKLRRRRMIENLLATITLVAAAAAVVAWIVSAPV